MSRNANRVSHRAGEVVISRSWSAARLYRNDSALVNENSAARLPRRHSSILKYERVGIIGREPTIDRCGLRSSKTRGCLLTTSDRMHDYMPADKRRQERL